MIFTLSAIAVLTAFVVSEVVLWPRYKKMLVSREHKVRTIRERLGRIRSALRTLSHPELQRFDHDLQGFLDDYHAIVFVYMETAARFRFPLTSTGLCLSNLSLQFTLNSLRRVEVEINARRLFIDGRILSWAERQLLLVLGELESTRRWVTLFLPEHEREQWFDKLTRASDALTSAHEHLRYDAQRVAHPNLMIRMRGALAGARESISEVQRRVQEATDEAMQVFAQQRLS